MRPSYETLLTHDFVRSVLDYDPETGIFTWKVARMKGRNFATVHRPVGSRAGCCTATYKGYEVIQINGYGSPVGSHRIAWFWMTGKWPRDGIDHINGDRADNRWPNLREATPAQNGCNRGAHKGRLYKGVSGSGSRWHAALTVDGETHRLGTYATQKAAALAVNDAAQKLHGEFARFNDVDESDRGERIDAASRPGHMHGVFKMNHRKNLWIARWSGQYLGAFRNPIEAGMAVHYFRGL